MSWKPGAASQTFGQYWGRHSAAPCGRPDDGANEVGATPRGRPWQRAGTEASPTDGHQPMWRRGDGRGVPPWAPAKGRHRGQPLRMVINAGDELLQGAGGQGMVDPLHQARQGVDLVDALGHLCQRGIVARKAMA